jgi:excisionase family DNA binding protein
MARSSATSQREADLSQSTSNDVGRLIRTTATSASTSGPERDAQADPVSAHGASGLDTLMTVEEVASALRVSAQFVYRHASDGDLPALNVGKAVRIKQSVVQAIIEGSLVLGRPKPSGGRRSRRLVGLPDSS